MDYVSTDFDVLAEAVFAGLTRVTATHIHTHTYRPTDTRLYATSSTCRNHRRRRRGPGQGKFGSCPQIWEKNIFSGKRRVIFGGWYNCFLADRTIGCTFGTLCCLSVVCRLSSGTFCIVAKRYVLAKNCLKEWIGNQGQKVDFLGCRYIFRLWLFALWSALCVTITFYLFALHAGAKSRESRDCDCCCLRLYAVRDGSWEKFW